MVPPWRACVKHHEQRLSGAAPESNRPSRGLHDRTGFEDSASAAERSDLRLLRASMRAWERDDLGDVALEVFVKSLGVVGELAAESMPVAISDAVLRVAHV